MEHKQRELLPGAQRSTDLTEAVGRHTEPCQPVLTERQQLRHTKRRTWPRKNETYAVRPMWRGTRYCELRQIGTSCEYRELCFVWSVSGLNQLQAIASQRNQLPNRADRAIDLRLIAVLRLRRPTVEYPDVDGFRKH